MNEQNIDGGYDFKLVKDDKNLECPICLLLLREAMGTQCRHLLCKICLEKLQRSSADAKRELICPTCKEKVDMNQVHPNFYIDGVVTGSDVFCLQEEAGCKWIGTLAAYLREHHDECDFVIITCDNIGCGEELARNLMKKHTKECPHRLENCVYCQMEVKFDQLEDHHGNTCQKIPINCFMGCGVQVSREKMNEHLDKHCGMVEVDCPFNNAGCNVNIKRMDVHRHNLEYTQVHMGFLCEKLHLSQIKIEQLENANSKSEQEIEELKMSNKQLKIANNQSQNDIEDLKMANNRSKNEIEELKMSNNLLEMANDESQSEIEELKRRITELENHKLVNSQSEDEKPKNVASNKVVSKPYETKHHMNPTASPYVPINNELKSLLQEGIRKFIGKEFNQHEYEKWYRMVNQKMEFDSVCENKDFLYMKLKISNLFFNNIRLNFMMKVRPVTNKGVINMNDGWIVKKKDGYDINVTLYTDKYNAHNCRCFRIAPGRIGEYEKYNDSFNGRDSSVFFNENVIICLKLLQ